MYAVGYAVQNEAGTTDDLSGTSEQNTGIGGVSKKIITRYKLARMGPLMHTLNSALQRLIQRVYRMLNKTAQDAIQHAMCTSNIIIE